MRILEFNFMGFNIYVRSRYVDKHDLIVLSMERHGIPYLSS